MADLLELGVTCFIIYMLYKLVFNFIMPVSKAASDVKSKINEFNRMQQEQMRRQSPPPPQPKPAPQKSSKEDDYIDFEEVK